MSWLVETYGIERLRSGAGVLDVAGGAGGTSFELAFRRGVPCTVVDPRPIKATAKQGRAMRCRAQVPAAARGGDRQRDGDDDGRRRHRLVCHGAVLSTSRPWLSLARQ